MDQSIRIAQSFLDDAYQQFQGLPDRVSEPEALIALQNHVRAAVLSNVDRARKNLDQAPPAEERESALLRAYMLQGILHAYMGEQERILMGGSYGDKHFENAIKSFETATKIREDQQAFYQLGLSHINLRRYDQAIAHLDHAIGIDPESEFSLKAMKAKQRAEEKKSSSSCFVATACYGSASHPDVLALRRWRDDCLLPNLVGRSGVRIYYILAPPVAFVLERVPVCARLIRRRILEPVVDHIRKQ